MVKDDSGAQIAENKGMDFAFLRTKILLFYSRQKQERTFPMCIRIGWAFLFAVLLFQAQPVSAASPIQLELHNEVVCYVNTDHISKKGVENRMLSEGGDVVIRLFMRRVQQKQEGTWDAKANYIRPFFWTS